MANRQSVAPAGGAKRARAAAKLRQQLPMHLMLLPCIALVAVFSYYPMVGILIAFQNYNPTKGFFGSKFVGLDNFDYVYAMPETMHVLWNTIYIALLKIVFGLLVPVVFAILLDMIRRSFVKRTIQTLIYIPHFLSWVILSGILVDILSPADGIINFMLKGMGLEPIFFLANEKLFPYILVGTDVWKEFGYGTIIYLAAITSIDGTLYEAAVMDGASRFRQVLHVTVPGIMPIVVLMATLSLGNVLNAGFEQVFNLYSPVVYKTGDILDTFVYRIGLLNSQYGVATAVGLFKSVVSFLFIVTGYKLASKFAGYRIF
ncbi:sugar ABC transporter permease [Paenibacillus lycopersici]|uniref:Sugar ABC transporter permease n=1 Tax=Paenibacillus lycopersici TaxID=2704462 RepID=A0A6C0G3C8_9BACL|nr:ABC transporter permease subunit [Paenibacillus lycopersici]QHT62251.1 sugar ABC transporter permease [Paenibacillus lycopersici]